MLVSSFSKAREAFVLRFFQRSRSRALGFMVEKWVPISTDWICECGYFFLSENSTLNNLSSFSHRTLLIYSFLFNLVCSYIYQASQDGELSKNKKSGLPIPSLKI